MAGTLELNPEQTALVVIDLQKGIVGMPAEPYPAQEVVANAARLADRFRELGSFVVLVNVGPSADEKDLLKPIIDNPPTRSGNARWDQIVPELGPQGGDHLIRKRQWGAFYGTDLDLQLRRRGIDTIVLCGIATTYGVESTARDAYERGYNQVFVYDACSDRTAAGHAFSLENVLSRIGRIRSTDEVLAALHS